MSPESAGMDVVRSLVPNRWGTAQAVYLSMWPRYGREPSNVAIAMDFIWDVFPELGQF